MQPYSLPFRVDRSRAPRIRMINVGSETLAGVTVSLVGRGVMPSLTPAVLRSGEALEFSVLGEELARETAVVVRWLRPSREEYLWRFVF